MTFSLLRQPSTVPNLLKILTANLSHIPSSIIKPPYALNQPIKRPPSTIQIKTDEQIALMRSTCKITKKILEYIKPFIVQGTTTSQIDNLIRNEIVKHSAYPSTLGYLGFPSSCCTSVNNVVVHGIPGDYALQGGDIINVDVTVYKDGVHGDSSVTFIVPSENEIPPSTNSLVDTTRESLLKAISICRPGEYFRSIGDVIQEYVHSRGFSLVEEFTGHGIGESFHEPPLIYHYSTAEYTSEKMQEGMVFTIEPMLCEGSNRIRIWDDQWTVVTEDEKRSCQFEHTILITKDGCEVLT